jgi:peptidoglycan/LPS O-acetylase OafA/YrhL
VNKALTHTENFAWRDNCLNTIKILAAFSVMFFHMKEHLDVAAPSFLSIVFGLFPGVPVFFFLSGFLVWNSVEKSDNIVEFGKKRFWRIFPQLWSAN